MWLCLIICRTGYYSCRRIRYQYKSKWYNSADAITLQTSVQDIFTGGDVYTGPRFAIDAIAQGKEAAESMHRFVHKGHSLTLGRDLHQFTQLDKDDILITLDFDHSKRQIPGTKQGSCDRNI